MKKLCKKCNHDKSLEDFYEINNKKKNKAGETTTYKTRHSYCKPCLKLYRAERYGSTDYDHNYHKKNQDKILDYQKEYYDANTEKVNESCRERYHNNKEKYSESHKKWKKRNPDAFKAYAAIARAKLSGKLTPPKQCENCAREVRLEAHHQRGYDELNQLKVLFICRKCHRRYHHGVDQDIQKQLKELDIKKFGAQDGE